MRVGKMRWPPVPANIAVTREGALKLGKQQCGSNFHTIRSKSASDRAQRRLAKHVDAGPGVNALRQLRTGSLLGKDCGAAVIFTVLTIRLISGRHCFPPLRGMSRLPQVSVAPAIFMQLPADQQLDY